MDGIFSHEKSDLHSEDRLRPERIIGRGRFDRVGIWLAVILLSVYAVATLSAWSTKTVAFDEPLHLAGGYASWVWDNYDLQPENGLLPQKVGALPLVLQHGTTAFGEAFDGRGYFHVWRAGQMLVFESGHDADRMIFWSRFAMCWLACGLGLLIFFWSRSLNGTLGALVSVGLFAFCPLMLAHGPLVTSDTASALFFLAAVASIWRMMHHLNWCSMLLTGLALGGLALSKMSAPLIVPVALILLVLRLIDGQPLRLGLRGKEIRLYDRVRQGVWNTVSLIAACLIAWIIIWAFFSWTFESSISRHDPVFNDNRWAWAMDQDGPIPGVVDFAIRRKLLPESYLFGFMHVLEASQGRDSFMHGRFSQTGWRTFFPFAFMVKTPLPVIVLILLALSLAAVPPAELSKRKNTKAQLWRKFYATAPLWVFIFVYMSAAVTSNLNIGIRHLLPVYGAIYVLLGGIGPRIAGSGPRWLRPAVAGLMLVLVVESLMIRPHYIAYFNQLAGGPSQGYRYLVDSSLDWGQDLPELGRWLERRRSESDKDERVYLYYFGNGDPGHYGLDATILPAFTAFDGDRFDYAMPLEPGLYAISATLFQGVYTEPILGPHWEPHHESLYRAVVTAHEQFEAAGDDPSLQQILHYRWSHDAERIRRAYLLVRLGKLTAYLRNNKSPIAQPGYSFLVFEVTQEDLNLVFN